MDVLKRQQEIAREQFLSDIQMKIRWVIVIGMVGFLGGLVVAMRHFNVTWF